MTSSQPQALANWDQNTWNPPEM